jgi:hypothetical protein
MLIVPGTEEPAIVRLPMIPVALLLVIAILLYVAFHGNRQVLEATDERPKLAFATANDLAKSMQVAAVRYRGQLGRWPATPADVNLDERWMNAHRGMESITYGANGTIRAHLRAASDGPATWIVWTPRQHGDEVIWDCKSDQPEIATKLEGCTAADSAQLASVAPVASDPGRDEAVEVSGLSERCQALGKVGHAAARARAEGVPVEDFIRQPVVAFVDDRKLRDELEEAARWVYTGVARAPSATQRVILTQYRCSPT